MCAEHGDTSGNYIHSLLQAGQINTALLLYADQTPKNVGGQPCLEKPFSATLGTWVWGDAILCPALG